MNKQLIITALALTSLTSQAQTGADYLKAYKKSDCTIAFDVNSEGETFRVKWGMDTAWDWDWNVNKGVAHYGKGLFETGRVSFQPIDLVTDNGDGTYTLSSRQQTRLKARINLIKATGTTVVNLNCDHEVLFKKVDNRGYCQEEDDPTGKKNYQGKPEEWYKLIKATTQYCQAQGLTVVSVSPFNESDFVNWQQYPGNEANGMKEFLAVAKLIKADPFFDDIRVCGGNTLNCDRALPWYNYLKEYLDEGNTHQLAGSFDTYANFFAQVKADGKVGTADELHNVGEAIVGANYGMTNGIWWGYDAKARGQFMHDSNEGVRIGYGEDRPHWVSGAVYRNEQTGEVHGYMGSSERQANTSTFQFVSTTRDVFFNGYGPTRHWAYTLPGGTGYQNGQINAELLFDITWGEDVAPYAELNGNFCLVNERSGKLLTMNGGNNVQSVSRQSTGTKQQWHVYPGYTDGDCSYWFIDNAGSSTAHLHLQDWNLKSGAGVTTMNASHNHNEQWYIKYAGNGAYYIIARHSNKYLSCSSTTSGANVAVADAPTEKTTASNLKNVRWRFVPVGEKYDTKAPAAPTSVKAHQRRASVKLNWKESIDEDVQAYTVLRSDLGKGGEAELGDAAEWNTIARIDTTMFIDNSVQKGHSYAYKVLAVDNSCNRSVPSDTIVAAPIDSTALICQLQFDKNLKDNSANGFDAALSGTEKFTATAALAKSGEASLNMTDGSSYMMLPYSVAHQGEMTIAAWVRMSSSYASWMRIFDFGNGTDQYMFLTPSNGTKMRFVMKNKGDEQVIETSKLSATVWHHVAVTIKPLDNGKVKAVLYCDGEVKAESDEFTIKPSDIAPSLCYIGRSMFSGDPLLKAYLDDFRIYNCALTAEQVAAMMEDTDTVSKDIVTYDESENDDEDTGISSVTTRSSSSAMYDLSGRKLATPSGIVIQNNKKKLIK